MQTLRIGRTAALVAGAALALTGASEWTALAAQAPLLTINGGLDGNEIGSSVAGVGDLNGDGTPDLLCGSFGSGARVHDGRTGALLFTLDTEPGDGCLGLTAAGVGDLSGDGVPDLALGAPCSGDGGRVRIYSGADGSVIDTVFADAAVDGFGHAVAGPGDTDGDGAGDLWVGTLTGGYARLVSGADGSTLFTLPGLAPGDGFGRAVAGAGDQDGDARPDLLVAAPAADRVLVVSGRDGRTLASHSGLAPGDGFGTAVAGGADVDRDGTDDLVVGAAAGYVLVLSGADGRVLHELRPDTLLAGGTSLASFGDVVALADLDADRHADILVGDAPAADGHGAVHVYSGATGQLLCEFVGLPLAEPTFGNAVAPVGDLDGDGLGDAIVGAPMTVNGQGHVRVFACRPSPWTGAGPGHGDVAPKLAGSGPLTGRSTTALHVFEAYGTGPGVLVVSLETVGAPLHGGVLVPAPDVLRPLEVGFGGDGELVAVFPEGVPAGTTIYAQFWQPNAFEPLGWTSSNALRAVTP